MLRRSKLALRVTEAASAVCGITFHPNGTDGGLTTVTLTLPLSTALPRLASLCRGGWGEITNIHNDPSPKTHGHLPNPSDTHAVALHTFKHSNMSLSQRVSSNGFIFKGSACAPLMWHLLSQLKVAAFDEWFIGYLACRGWITQLNVIEISHMLVPFHTTSSP